MPPVRRGIGNLSNVSVESRRRGQGVPSIVTRFCPIEESNARPITLTMSKGRGPTGITASMTGAPTGDAVTPSSFASRASRSLTFAVSKFHSSARIRSPALTTEMRFAMAALLGAFCEVRVVPAAEVEAAVSPIREVSAREQQEGGLGVAVGIRLQVLPHLVEAHDLGVAQVDGRVHIGLLQQRRHVRAVDDERA